MHGSRLRCCLESGTSDGRGSEGLRAGVRTKQCLLPREHGDRGREFRRPGRLQGQAGVTNSMRTADHEPSYNLLERLHAPRQGERRNEETAEARRHPRTVRIPCGIPSTGTANYPAFPATWSNCSRQPVTVADRPASAPNARPLHLPCGSSQPGRDKREIILDLPVITHEMTARLMYHRASFFPGTSQGRQA